MKFLVVTVISLFLGKFAAGIYAAVSSSNTTGQQKAQIVQTGAEAAVQSTFTGPAIIIAGIAGALGWLLRKVLFKNKKIEL